jgi:predicted transcriptional regulator
MRRALDEMRL